MKNPDLFYDGTELRVGDVTYDPVSTKYTLEVLQGKVYYYSRRVEKQQYEVQTRSLWICIDISTPHVNSFYKEAKENNQKVNTELICSEIKRNWKSYVSYGLYKRQPAWITMQEGVYFPVRERISKEEMLDFMGIAEDEIDSNTGLRLVSPY